jgi:hypothetical protein
MMNEEMRLHKHTFLYFSNFFQDASDCVIMNIEMRLQYIKMDVGMRLLYVKIDVGMGLRKDGCWNKTM